MHDELEMLCEQYCKAKMEEQEATERRIEVEQKITEITGLPEEGSKTHNAGQYKVKVEQRIIRSLDPLAWATVKDGIPEEISPVKAETVYKLDSKGVRWMKENEAGYFALLAKAMEEKPAKPSVKVEAA